MGTWGYEAFDSDSAGDLMGCTENMLLKPIHKVTRSKKRVVTLPSSHKTRVRLPATYHYEEARAAAMALLALSKASRQITEAALEDAATALARMLEDVDWWGSFRKPDLARENIRKELRRVKKQISTIQTRHRSRALASQATS